METGCQLVPKMFSVTFLSGFYPHDYIELLSFIRPVLEYADVIWNNCKQYESNELEKFRMKRRVLSPVHAFN